MDRGGTPRALPAPDAADFAAAGAQHESPTIRIRAGLHHLCLQAATHADVDAAYRALTRLGIPATPPKLYPEYNPEYYATFFEDPDGIRLEVVGRTSTRQALFDRWSQFTTFLNPWAR